MAQDDDSYPSWLSAKPRKAADVTGDRTYRAYDGPVDRRQLRIHICPRESEAWEWLPYIDLDRVVHDGRGGTIVGLIWPYAVVKIKGKRLQGLHAGIAQEAVPEIRVFDPSFHDQPADEAAPFIESIEIETESRAKILEAEMLLLTDIKDARH